MREFLDTLLALKQAGVNVIDINSSRGKKDQIVLTSTQLAGQAQKKFGFETIPHVTTRDMSLAGLINEIETTFALGGVTDFLIITGDPHDSDQNFPHTGVFEVDAIGAIKALNKYLKPRDAFSLAGAINQNEPETEAERVKRKIDAGADFLMSQTIFGIPQAKQAAEFCDKHVSPKPFMIGVWPIVRQKTVEAIRKGRVVGVVLDDETFAEVSRYFGDDKALEKWGLERAAETVAFIRDNRLAAGAYLVAPSHNPLLSVEILRIAGLL